MIHLYNVDYWPAGKINTFVLDKDQTKDKILKQSLVTKRDEWEYEQEWRLVSIEGEPFCSIQQSLNTIILGCEFNKDYLSGIRKLIEGTDIEIKQLRINNKSQNFLLAEI